MFQWQFPAALAEFSSSFRHYGRNLPAECLLRKIQRTGEIMATPFWECHELFFVDWLVQMRFYANQDVIAETNT